MKPFKLTVTMEGEEISVDNCLSLTIPTSDGLYGILANHSPVIVAVTKGNIKYRTDEGENFLPVEGAVVRFENNTARILARRPVEKNKPEKPEE